MIRSLSCKCASLWYCALWIFKKIQERLEIYARFFSTLQDFSRSFERLEHIFLKFLSNLILEDGLDSCQFKRNRVDHYLLLLPYSSVTKKARNSSEGKTQQVSEENQHSIKCFWNVMSNNLPWNIRNLLWVWMTDVSSTAQILPSVSVSFIFKCSSTTCCVIPNYIDLVWVLSSWIMELQR